MGESINLKQQIQQISEVIGKTTELFYTQNEAQGYQAFGMLLKPLEDLLNRLFVTRAAEGKPEFDEEELVRLLTEATGAMETKDSVLLADILQYDFLDQLEKISARL